MTEADERWAVVFECEADRCHVPVGAQLEPGRTMLVGREGDLPIGVDVFDQGISRRAGTVRTTESGWDLEISNSNGAVVHPWAQPPELARRWVTMSWPRIAIRFLNGARPGDEGGRAHWLLLEADALPVTPDGPGTTPATTSRTFQSHRPTPLSDRQQGALQVMFADFLTWPPAPQPEAKSLRVTARTLGISESGVQERLSKARDKAHALGLQRQVGLTDPEYLYTLVRAGHLPLERPPLYRRRL